MKPTTSKPTKTYIFYHVINDKDDPEIPNVFVINLPIEEIRVGHIKKNFPLSGDYYFRFKFQSNNTIIWMDLNNDDCKMPLYNGQIFMKVERFSWENPEKEIAELRKFEKKEEPININVSNQTNQNTRLFYSGGVQNTVPRVQETKNDLLDF